MRIKGKTAIVTGASSGLGRATALLLAKYGASVALVARRQELLEEVATEALAMGGGGTVLAMPSDVGDPAQVSASMDLIRERLGEPDILVNAAGVGIWKRFAEVTDAEHHAMMQVNYWGAFHWIRHVLPGMRERRRGRIVNVSSGAGKIGFSVTSGYSASKFALTGLSEALHRELLGSGVGVSCIHPGSMRTSFWNEANTPTSQLPPLIRFAPKLSAKAVARNICYCIWLGIPVRTLPIFVGLLTRANALWIRLGDLMLWKWFVPALVVAIVLRLLL